MFNDFNLSVILDSELNTQVLHNYIYYNIIDRKLFLIKLIGFKI